ncbi:MAG: MBL fold metallo-hydrolase [Candidatus Hodarchaeota archaeon]
MVVKKIEHGPILEWLWGTDNKLMPEPYWTSCYLVDGLLIDCGAPGSVDDLREFITNQKVEVCVVTHGHEDHAGGARMLKEEFSIPILASEKGVKFLSKGYNLPDYRQVAWGKKLEPVEAQIIGKTLQTQRGRFEFDVVPLPGHAPCLIGLIEKNQQWAFVTDAVVPRYRMIFGGDSNIQENIKEIHDTIVMLHIITKDMEDLKVFLSGHGLMEGGRQFLKERILEIEALHEKAHELNEQGLKTRKMLKIMFGGETFIAPFTRGALSRENLLKSLLNWPISS